MHHQLINKLKLSLTFLPGTNAQYKMAPLNRSFYLNLEEKKKNARKSAVCILFYLKVNKLHTILMQRTNMGLHANQISFAGGTKEDLDNDYADAALREFNEEIGVLKNNIYLGPITPLYIPPSNFYVEPHIYFTSEEINFAPQKTEVVEIIEADLSILFNDENISEITITANNLQTKAPCIVYNKYNIWGATAMMISELKEIWKQQNLPFKI